MTEKRFTLKYINEQHISSNLYDNGTFIGAISHIGAELIVDLLNELHEENKELKKELGIYRKVANCRNCLYHNYNWYDDGDEFEVCDKGNTEQLMYHSICEEWREL